MDLGLSEIQQMLKTSALEFLSRECPATLVREMEEDERGYPNGLWRQMINLGWTGVPFPEQYGGTGGDFLDLAVLLEEMGRALITVSASGSNTTMSASLPTAMVPLRGKRPKSLAGLVENSSTSRLRSINPEATPWV